MLKLKIDEGALDSNPKIYHLGANGEWEEIGGTIEDGYITASVETFSVYGVFAEATQSPDDPTKDDPKDPTKPTDPSTTPPNEEDGKGGQGPVASGKPLPKTATHFFNMMMIGAAFLLLGGMTAIYYLRKRRMN